MSSAEQLLAIETSTRVCSVCYRDSKGEVFEKRDSGRGIHSEKMFTFIEELMNNHDFQVNDLDAVLVSSGPGSYTGLRIAASGIKGLLFDVDCRLYGIDTLPSFAVAAFQQHPQAKSIHAMIDARREHVYYHHFEVAKGELLSRDQEAIEEIRKVNERISADDIVIGTGLQRLDSESTGRAILLDEGRITAASLIRIYEEYRDSEWIRETEVRDFNPRYLSNQQLNNSNIKQS